MWVRAKAPTHMCAWGEVDSSQDTAHIEST
jgi:hypothetical protein